MRRLLCCLLAGLALGGCTYPFTHDPFEASKEDYFRHWEFRLYQVVRYAGTRKNQDGLVTLRLVVLQDGSVESFGVLRTSGSEELDRQALQFVEKTFPLRPFPAPMRERLNHFIMDYAWSFNGNGVQFIPSMRQSDACRTGKEPSCMRFPADPRKD